MDFVQIILSSLLVILSLMTMLWLLSLLLRDASIVDIFWGMGFVIINGFYYFQAYAGYPQRKWLVTFLVTVWGLRLSLHLLKRNYRRGEDYRYREWREQSGVDWWWKSYFKVFLLQGMVMWIVSAPLLAAQHGIQAARLTWLDLFAVLVWSIGFFFEAVGDWQLMRFKADPANRGKLLTGGVWRYSRHPNYFGDAAQWWGFYLFALAAGGWWTIFSPLLMSFLLLRVSGVAMLEKSLQTSKPGYEQYIASTSAFFPWFPRRR